MKKHQPRKRPNQKLKHKLNRARRIRREAADKSGDIRRNYPNLPILRGTLPWL